jgi:hypothetical protein
MVYITWNFWVSGLYPSSGIPKNAGQWIKSRIPEIPMFVIVHLQTLFHTESVGMFVIQLHTIFHMSRLST